MIVALAGGVGGAKLADGLLHVLEADQLTVVVNTGDDFDWLGLRVCPDADTVMYTLAGMANQTTGWGVAGDTFHALELLGRYGHDTWFQVGDRDLATHVARTERLRAGDRLTAVTAALTSALGVRARILPMCDEPVATAVVTPAGTLDFQDYFVRRQHRDVVTGVAFRGVDRARVPDAVGDAAGAARAIIFCPSNPIVSIGPILAVPGMRELLAGRSVPSVAVSPIVGGRALRGPADHMLESLGHEVSACGVAALYQGLIDGFVVDQADASLAGRIEDLGIRVLVTATVMTGPAERRQLAEQCLTFCDALRRRSG